jgi:helicase required for RNAi-mediated heterochromatin assembly 1
LIVSPVDCFANICRFSLAEHIAMVNPIVSAPSYVENHSIMDLSSLVLPKENLERPEAPLTDESLLNIDVLRDFPPIPASGMDSLQMEALKSMLVKKVAIVQGPPGIIPSSSQTFIQNP